MPAAGGFWGAFLHWMRKLLIFKGFQVVSDRNADGKDITFCNKLLCFKNRPAGSHRASAGAGN